MKLTSDVSNKITKKRTELMVPGTKIFVEINAPGELSGSAHRNENYQNAETD
jgi:hypothetical protein